MKKPAPAPRKPQEKVEGPFSDTGLLPPRVDAMREKILEACTTGNIENLRPAIERNEVMPLFGKAGDRPKSFATVLEFLRQRSFDGKGRETLALLEAALTSDFAKVLRGQHLTYVWPSLALLPLKEVDTETRLAMLRCIAFSDLAMVDGKSPPPFQRVEIGEDGTWHAFGVS